MPLNNASTSKLCMQTLLDTTLTLACEQCLELFNPSKVYMAQHQSRFQAWLCSNKCRREWGLESKRLWYMNNKDVVLGQRRVFYYTNHESVKARNRALNHKYRSKALEMVGRGKVSCVYCGCDFIPTIEINHKNGGGMSEFRRDGGGFYWRIASGRRSIDDLELACQVCNWVHYVKLKHGKNIGRYKVTYEV